MRYVVVGTSGAGKTRFARELAQVLSVPHIELDALHWGANWTPRPLDEFRQSVERVTSPPAWVVDGNYGAVRDLVWARATHVVWLNFGRSVVWPRVVWRTLNRTLLRQPLWHGNRESFLRSFFSRDSVVLWSVRTFATNQRQYATLRDGPDHAHLAWVELRSPRDATAFLAAPSPPVECLRSDIQCRPARQGCVRPNAAGPGERPASGRP